MVAWLGVCLLVLGTRVRALVWGDPACYGAPEPVYRNYWACTLEPPGPQLLSPHAMAAETCAPRAHAQQRGVAPVSPAGGGLRTATKTQHGQNKQINEFFFFKVVKKKSLGQKRMMFPFLTESLASKYTQFEEGEWNLSNGNARSFQDRRQHLWWVY